jgi:protein-S-isoprenylcysteine O-methyltransferase Ste14
MGTGTTRFTPQSWALSAGCCFAGGIGAGLVGSVLTSLSWIIGAEVHPWVRGFGTLLLILTIPLLILAGHCLDRFERETKNSSFLVAQKSKSNEAYT